MASPRRNNGILKNVIIGLIGATGIMILHKNNLI